MNYFLVFQNKSFKEERSGGYLWSPQVNEKGQTFHHWTDMKNVKKGDVIFNSYNGEMVSVLFVKEDYFEHDRPNDLDEFKLWEKKGWMVKVEYIDLKNPIKYKNYMDKILQLQGEKYAPFNVLGRGNTGYLFRVTSELADFLFNVLEQNNLITRESIILDYQSIDLNAIKTIEKDLEIPIVLDETEKELIVKARVGQSLFKKALLKQGKQCKLCGVNDERFLVASHIKPWSKSNNEERLDVNNGLLLCPNHDSLFDKGFVSFYDDGSIMITESIDNHLKMFLNINDRMKIQLSEKHQQYIKWHRKNIFKN
jgi:putative restriction endonuclease